MKKDPLCVTYVPVILTSQCPRCWVGLWGLMTPFVLPAHYSVGECVKLWERLISTTFLLKYSGEDSEPSSLIAIGGGLLHV